MAYEHAYITIGSINTMDDTLKYYSRAGWELVSVVNHVGGWTLFFKRDRREP